MKAILKLGQGEVALKDVPAAELSPDQIRIDVAAVGICGTDRSSINSATDKHVPRILGHEVSGIVAEVGSEANCPGIEVGDRVTVETDAYLCRVCHWCKTEQYQRCASRTGIGTTTDGGLAEQLVIRADAAHKIPDSVSLLAAALTEPLAVAVHAVFEQSPSLAGQVVVVTGPGAVGQLVAQTAKAGGATPILVGCSRHEQRLARAKANGINYTLDCETEDLASLVSDLTGGLGAHSVFECSGSKDQLRAGSEILARGGRLVMLAFYPGDLPITANWAMNRELEIVGSRGKKPSSFRTALRLMGSGAIDMASVIDAVEPFENVDRAFDLVGQGKKVVMVPNLEMVRQDEAKISQLGVIR